jgi:hypothetical protein
LLPDIAWAIERRLQMNKHIVLAAAAAMASVVWVSGAEAQSHENVTTTGPNRAMLHTGLFTFGVPYVVSVIVAAESDHQGDKNLYIPVAGPWMDFAQRGDCGNAGQNTCDTETGYKVLLVVDGIFQGVGALDIVGSFLFPETRTVATAPERKIAITPGYVGRGAYGLVAVGAF